MPDDVDLLMFFLTVQHQLLVLDLFGVKLPRPNYCLGGVVDQDVQLQNLLLYRRDQIHHLGLGEEVAFNYVEPIAPHRVVLLTLVTEHSVLRKPGGRVDLGSLPQQLQHDLKAYLDPASS